MKKDIHPPYNLIVFHDTQSGVKFITRSTLTSSEKIKWEDGNEYPVVKVEISSASHPFYTGKRIFVDTAGRVEKFNKRYGAKKKARKEGEPMQEVRKEGEPLKAAPKKARKEGEPMKEARKKGEPLKAAPKKARKEGEPMKEARKEGEPLKAPASKKTDKAEK